MNRHILLLFSLVILGFVFYRVITKTTWKYWLQNIREGMKDDDALLVEETMDDGSGASASTSTSASAGASRGASTGSGAGTGAGSGAGSSSSANASPSSNAWTNLIQQISSVAATPSTKPEPTKSDANCMDYADAMRLPLREYAIKASYNTAYDGSRISETQLGDIMYNGCRMVDLNVFYADDKLYVGYAPDNNPTTVDTSLPFSTAISYILRYAFVIDPAKQKKPLNEVVKEFEEDPVPTNTSVDIKKNYIDFPFVIHIRIYRPENSSLNIIEKVAEYMKEIIASPYFYGTPDRKPILVDGNTALCQINRKFIISMDVRNIVQIYAPSANQSAEYIPQPTLNTLRGFVNILTGGHTWRSYYNYNDVMTMNKNVLRITNGGVLSENDSSGKQTSVQNMYVVFPFISDKENPDSLAIMKNYSIQTIPNRFYIQDGNLDKYANFFRRAQKPFVPMSEVLFFIAKTESAESSTQ